MTFPATAPVVQIYAGDTYTQTYVFKDDAGVAIDLSAEGWGDWAAQYRTTRPALTAHDFDVDATLASQGSITVSMTKEATDELVHNGVWDLQATNGAALKTWITGAVHVEKDVTRV